MVLPQLSLFKQALGLFACLSVCLMCGVPLETRRGHWIPGARVTDNCELSDLSAGR